MLEISKIKFSNFKTFCYFYDSKFLKKNSFQITNNNNLYNNVKMLEIYLKFKTLFGNFVIRYFYRLKI